MDKDDLDLVPTDELIDALHRRMGEHGCLLVAGTTSDGTEMIRWKGGQTLALGMALRSAVAFLFTNAKPMDPEGT